MAGIKLIEKMFIFRLVASTRLLTSAEMIKATEVIVEFFVNTSSIDFYIAENNEFRRFKITN